MDLSDLHGHTETTVEDEQKLSEQVNKKSQELLVHLNERAELVNSIQLKNRFIGKHYYFCLFCNLLLHFCFFLAHFFLKKMRKKGRNAKRLQQKGRGCI